MTGRATGGLARSSARFLLPPIERPIPRDREPPLGPAVYGGAHAHAGVSMRAVRGVPLPSGSGGHEGEDSARDSDQGVGHRSSQDSALRPVYTCFRQDVHYE
jgi:hypothetical protein